VGLPVLPAAVVLGIDPGHHVGLAWVDASGKALALVVVEETGIDGLQVPPTLTVALGDGTGSRRMRRRLEDLGVSVTLIDERHSSEEARERYWSVHPARGPLRWLPIGLRPPPADLDAYAAWVIALRALRLQQSGRHPSG